MPFRFDDAEFAARQARAAEAVRDAGLDAHVMFAPESQYWICGHDTFGFAMFQALVLTAAGELHLMTRQPDLMQARLTSTLSDDRIHVWPEYEGSNPAGHLRNLLADLGVATGGLGYESRTAGLTDYNARQHRLHAAATEALEVCEAAIRPGRPMGEVFDAHACPGARRAWAVARANAGLRLRHGGRLCADLGGFPDVP